MALLDAALVDVSLFHWIGIDVALEAPRSKINAGIGLCARHLECCGLREDLDLAPYI